MISQNTIIAWRKHAPWVANEQVEQDFVISQALIALFSNPLICEKLAFRGDTALHKLYLNPAVRYSEDIDLVQLAPEPAGSIIDEVKAALYYLGKPRLRQKLNNNTLIFSFESEIQPITTLKLKIEINCREHHSVHGICKIPYAMNTVGFSGQCEIGSYQLAELLGTKLRALFQRRKGRDLFDLWYALTQTDTRIESVIDCFDFYMRKENNRISKREFELNLEQKIKDPDFCMDMRSLLRPGVVYTVPTAYEWFMLNVLPKLS